MTSLKAVCLTVLLTFSIVSGALGEEDCTSETLAACSEDFNVYGATLPTANLERQVKWFNESQLTELCRLYDEFETCIAPFKSQCEIALQIIITSVEVSYGTMCEAGLSVYAESEECYLDDGLEDALVECQTAFTAAAAQYEELIQNATTQADKDELAVTHCETVNGMMMCLTEAFYATEACAEESINLQILINTRVQEPLLEQIGCSVKEQCASARQQRCTDGLDTAYGQDWEQFRARTSDQMDALCQGDTDYDTCLNPFKAQCSADKLKPVMGLRDASKYICTDGGKAVYLEHMSCLNETVEEEASVCYKRGNDKIVAIEAVEDYPTVSDQEKEDYCKAIDDDMLDCVTEVLEKYCDEKLVKYQFNVDKEFWEPAAAIVGCSLSSEGPQPGSAASLLPPIAVYLFSLALIVYNQVM